MVYNNFRMFSFSLSSNIFIALYRAENMYFQMHTDTKYTNSNNFTTTAEYTTAKELREMSDKVQVDADIQEV